jgi:hypothetical protein
MTLPMRAKFPALADIATYTDIAACTDIATKPNTMSRLLSKATSMTSDKLGDNLAKQERLHEQCEL